MSKRFFNRPFLNSEPRSKGEIIHSYGAAPFGNSFCSSFVGDEKVAPQVNKARVSGNWYNYICHLLTRYKLMIRGALLQQRMPDSNIFEVYA